MIITVLKDDCTLAENAVEIVKSNNISAFNEKVTSALDEQVAETLKIDKFFNFCCLQELETGDSEQRVFLTCDE